MDQLAPHKVMQPTAKGHLATPSAPLEQHPVPVPAKPRAIRLGGVCQRAVMPQFPPDGRGAAPQQQADRPKARPAPLLPQNHATVLAVEVLVSSVHRNIPCPAGAGCCTQNLSLRGTAMEIWFQE